MSRRSSISAAGGFSSGRKNGLLSAPSSSSSHSRSPSVSISSPSSVSVSQSLHDRKKRGEAGMSVLKWKLAALQGKTRERERGLRGDRDDIELLCGDEQDGAEKKEAGALEAAGKQTKRAGLRERLSASQVMRGKEIRRAELRRKKSRKPSDDEEKEDEDDDDGDATNTAAGAEGRRRQATGDAAGGGQRAGGSADTEGAAAAGGVSSRQEAKQQLDTDRTDASQGDFLSSLHSDSHQPDSARERRRERGDSQPLKAVLDAVTHSTDRQRRNAAALGVAPLSLAQLLQRQKKDGAGAAAAAVPPHLSRRRSVAEVKLSPPSVSSFLVAAALPGSAAASSLSSSRSSSDASLSTFPSVPLSVSSVAFTLSSPPPLSLPVLPCLSLSLSFLSLSLFKSRASHFQSLFLCPPSLALLSSLFWYCHATFFQNDAAAVLRSLQGELSLHSSRWSQLAELSLTLPARSFPRRTSDEEEVADSALYSHLLSLLPEGVAVSAAVSSSVSASASFTRSGSNPVKERLLTAYPLLLSSAVYSLLRSLFPLSQPLLTLHLLQQLDALVMEMMTGFRMTDTTLSRLRARYFQHRQPHEFIAGGAAATADDQAAGRGGGAEKREGEKGGKAGSPDSLFARGDWAQDEKERREEQERRRALSSPSSSSPSSLSPEFIRTDPLLSPYQRLLLLALLSPASHARHDSLNANSLTPLLSVGLQRLTPDSSWRREHRLRYIVPAERRGGAAAAAAGEEAKADCHWSEAAFDKWRARARGEGKRRTAAAVRVQVVMEQDSGSGGLRAEPERQLAVSQLSSQLKSEREKVQEGDPLSVLTPRTRRLILRYSSREDDEGGGAAAGAGGGPGKGRSEAAASALLSVGSSSKVAETGDMLSLDLRSVGGGGSAQSSARRRSC